MKEKIILESGSITVDIPDGFQRMTAEEIQQSGGSVTADQWCIKNEEEHLAFNIAWNKLSFFTKLVSLEKTVENIRNSTGRKVSGFKTYEDIHTTIGGEKAIGFQYGYTAAGTEYRSEYDMIRYQGHQIAFVQIGRETDFVGNQAVFQTIIDSIKLSAE